MVQIPNIRKILNILIITKNGIREKFDENPKLMSFIYYVRYFTCKDKSYQSVSSFKPKKVKKKKIGMICQDGTRLVQTVVGHYASNYVSDM